MSTNPLVTVITIFFNEERFIREAVESVLAQTYSNWELLLVDDGSTDGSTEIAREYGRGYPEKVRYVEHEGHHNRGMSASRNLGIRAARGELIGFVDADDIWLPAKLERQVAILNAEPDAAFVFGPSEFWFSWTLDPDDRGRDFVSLLPVPPDRLVKPPALLNACSPLGKFAAASTCSFLMRRELADRVGGFEDSFHGWFEDLAFLAKVHLKANVYVSGECLARYRMHPDSYVSLASRAGEYRSSMLFLLKWLEGYLTRENLQEPRVWRDLRKALWRHRLFVLQNGWNRLRRLGERIGSAWRRGSIAAINRKRFLRGGVSGRITAEPNPITLSEFRFDVSTTTLSWASSGTDMVEVHVDRPDGPLLSSGGPSGSKATGKWVRDGMVFFLQDVTSGKLLTEANTLATVRVKVLKPRRLLSFVTRKKGQSSTRGVVLMYHRVAETPSDPWSLCVTPTHFDEQLDVMTKIGNSLTLSEMVQTLRKPQRARHPFVVTFDDGYADNLHNAKPLLERHGIPATVFIVSGSISRDGEFWWDELERLLFTPERLPEELELATNGTTYRWQLGDSAELSEETRKLHAGWRALDGTQPTERHEIYISLHRVLQDLPEDERLRTLEKLRSWAGRAAQAHVTTRPLNRDELTSLGKSGLVSIGAHTVTHPVLPGLTARLQEMEIEQSKADLEEACGLPIRQFAYPFGRYGEETIGIVREAGFTCACTTSESRVSSQCDPFQLPRFRVEDWNGEEFARRFSGWFESLEAPV